MTRDDIRRAPKIDRPDVGAIRKPLSHEDKEAIAEYCEAGLRAGRERTDLLVELSEHYGRSTRQIERYIRDRRERKAVEAAQSLEVKHEEKSYEETPHKQKMRLLASMLREQIWFTPRYQAFWDFRPRRYVIPYPSRETPGVLSFELTKSNQIRILMPKDEDIDNQYLWQGLEKHLESGGFGDVLDNLSGWKELVEHCILLSQKLFKVAIGKTKGQVKIPDDAVERNERPGYQVSFFTSACADAVEIAKGNPPVTDSGYWHQPLTNNLNLWILTRSGGVGGIYVGQNNKELEAYQSMHRHLADRLSKSDQAKKIAELYKDLQETSSYIKQQLQKFKDMDRVPGRCELC